jgi:hypothetical protein
MKLYLIALALFISSEAMAGWRNYLRCDYSGDWPSRQEDRFLEYFNLNQVGASAELEIAAEKAGLVAKVKVLTLPDHLQYEIKVFDAYSNEIIKDKSIEVSFQDLGKDVTVFQKPIEGGYGYYEINCYIDRFYHGNSF